MQEISDIQENRPGAIPDQEQHAHACPNERFSLSASQRRDVIPNTLAGIVLSLP
jgi:hypothetical protein